MVLTVLGLIGIIRRALKYASRDCQTACAARSIWAPSTRDAECDWAERRRNSRIGRDSTEAASVKWRAASATSLSTTIA